jgi:hypothetical protein
MVPGHSRRTAALEVIGRCDFGAEIRPTISEGPCGGGKYVALLLVLAALDVRRTEQLARGTLVKAIARAHRWQGMLDSGAVSSIEELAQAERINPSYLARVLRLTLLAPEIVESILDGRHDPERVALERLMRPFPALWGEQLQSL